jgi:hypothetical protein
MPSFRSSSLKEEILDMFSKEIGIKAPSDSRITRIIKWIKERKS